jgi:pantetheine-phosphate adenylyltransferase
MKSGVFAGTFDPVTNGHLDLIHRALGVVDRLVVAVAPRPEKGVLFTLEERVAMIQSAVGTESRVTVEPFQGLLVDHAKARGIPIIIRGVRFVSDFEYEFKMALMNRRLNPNIETIFLMPSEQFTYVNSTLVKEIARHGGDVNPFVPQNVRERLDQALRKQAAR